MVNVRMSDRGVCKGHVVGHYGSRPGRMVSLRCARLCMTISRNICVPALPGSRIVADRADGQWRSSGCMAAIRRRPS